MKHIVGATAWLGVRVELDGVPIDDWYEADDVAGYVLIPVRDADGIPGTADDHTVVMQRRDGQVTFVPVEADA